jgi:hypothetical protein
MRFHFHRLRFEMEAREPVYLPPGKAGNVLRGSLGLMLQAVDRKAYERLFVPRSESGPSGLADAPRPFVFRVAPLEAGLRAAPGDRFVFAMNLFEEGGESGNAFAAAFERLGREGLGPGRGKAVLVDWQQQPSSVNLSERPEALDRIRLRFVTPTEIKGDGGLLREPLFGILMARIRDRISTLRGLYGAGPLEMDFREFGERAKAVRLSACDVRQVEGERKSTRTGQSHPLGGFVGTAAYEGDLAEFLPYLMAAPHTGVGRQTVWGKGEIAIL